MKGFTVSLLASGASCLFANTAAAAILLSFSPSSPDPLVAGSAGAIQLLLASDNPADQVGKIDAQFLITPLTGPAGGLEFAATQSQAQLANANYIFFGGSSVPSASVGPSDSYVVSVASTAGPITVQPNTFVAFTIDLNAISPGDYRIDLVAAFVEKDPDEGGLLEYLSSPRVLTVRRPVDDTPIPEPSSAVAWSILALLGMAAGHARRRERPAPQTRTSAAR